MSPRQIVRPAYCIPETKNAFELLEEMRNDRRQIAIVLDEYGGVVGLVTLEDLLEELVGAIDDEHDVPTPADPVRPIGESRYEVNATLPIESLNERLGLHLPTDGEYLTVGGLALHSLGRVPEPGETFRADGAQIHRGQRRGSPHPETPDRDPRGRPRRDLVLTDRNHRRAIRG